ncbi:MULTISPECIES: GAF domain-containing sensor histidine kinase [unclassified Colwellia]|uniref:GAF domain-containing sensor histidine kinase n=1 Tax=unclassified Colwellia TaxID=196834 RepID=UPI0015F6E518|nr:MULTISPECIES: GAF domain-containing sensor histidine kinase [unclassified Colwellia]MBA6231663.1 GAF domain-containing sensor histidine kinase [Colwellia sp. MB02u-7]MBA6235527.1 GAF domain-containing sensor histidine kinase [Colwellia sp. MB02u-11]MBA6258081.1 GAF domain-containing sensor histidine kinase [Colwellia sp. MB3u-28]MBA6259775.1 GAF domain-containing sensor histidine kinase [Colwellia sp. MB3u-41]MBA6300251.1 GAF domain-containing sensor histidine kinase [Colwellia sp. MB3u-22]
MISAGLHPKETQRIDELLRYEVLDTEDEKALDELTQLASAICGTSISLISLIDKDRQWFKSRVGLNAPETPREIAFCSHAILQDQIFEIPDTLEDKRFIDNPLVTGAPDIRFYAGAPLVSTNGLPIGTLCVIDTAPKKLDEKQQLALTTLAKQVVSQLELRLRNRQLLRMQKDQEKIFAVMSHDLRSPFNGILGLSKILHQNADTLEPELIAEMANGILESSLTFYQLLDEILQWSRNQLGAIHVELKATALNPLITETLDLMKENFILKKLTIKHEKNEDTQAMADVNLTKTILRNLLANAIKYTPEQGNIHIKTQTIKGEVQLIITDTGQGIPLDIQSGLFSESVASNHGTQGELGHGLGLSLCGDFARKQQGYLSLDKEYKDGAKLILNFPRIS